jgi:hypothetical protein
MFEGWVWCGFPIFALNADYFPCVQEVYRWLLQRYERAICLLASDVRPFLPPPNMAPPLTSKMAAKQHLMFFLASIRQEVTCNRKLLHFVLQVSESSELRR